jgi:hypothetical protein
LEEKTTLEVVDRNTNFFLFVFHLVSNHQRFGSIERDEEKRKKKVKPIKMIQWQK